MTTNTIAVHIEPTPEAYSGKVADAELRFTEGPLKGMKLIGFAIWERRPKAAGYNVTFPSRTYSVNGERRSFALLRPYLDGNDATNNVRDLILSAWSTYQATQAQPATVPTQATQAATPAPGGPPVLPGIR